MVTLKTTQNNGFVLWRHNWPYHDVIKSLWYHMGLHLLLLWSNLCCRSMYSYTVTLKTRYSMYRFECFLELCFGKVKEASFSFPKIVPKIIHMYTLHTNMSFYITLTMFHYIGYEHICKVSHCKYILYITIIDWFVVIYPILTWWDTQQPADYEYS